MAQRDLFVIGDSISQQYGPYLERMVAGQFRYARKTGTEPGLEDIHLDHPASEEGLHTSNGCDSRAVRAYVELRLRDPAWRPDWLLLNAGLHDIKVPPGSDARQVPLEEYRENLRATLAALAGRGVRVLWVRTSPLDEARHNARSGPGMGIHRYQADHAAYDAAALAVMAEADVPVIDLLGFTRSLEGEVFRDHVHFVEPVRALQAAYIAGHLAAR